MVVSYRAGDTTKSFSLLEDLTGVGDDVGRCVYSKCAKYDEDVDMLETYAIYIYIYIHDMIKININHVVMKLVFSTNSGYNIHHK